MHGLFTVYDRGGVVLYNASVIEVKFELIEQTEFDKSKR